MKVQIKSGDLVKCSNCGYEGRVYGTHHSRGVSDPMCPVCGDSYCMVHIDDKKAVVPLHQKAAAGAFIFFSGFCVAWILYSVWGYGK